MKRERILVIASDNDLSSQIIKALREAGYAVWRAKDMGDGLKKLPRVSPDLVIMEREYSLVSRQVLCSYIRQASYVPIVAVGSDLDPTSVLEIGADAYMAKPPNLRELTARVRALLRRKNVGQMDIAPFNTGNDRSLVE